MIRRQTHILGSLALALVVALLAVAPAAAQGAAEPNADNQAVLDKLMELTGGVKLETLPPAEARQAPTFADAVRGVLQDRGESTAPEPVADVRDTTIPGPAGEISVRIYTPAGDGPFPVIVYYHGGGWTIADYNVYDSSGRALANAAGAVVVSVNYRLAPENPFPAAADDAYASYVWATENADEINGDPETVAVAGESAGGNLAAVTSIRARDEGVQMPVHQLLVYPITNYAFDTESYETYANAMPLSRPLMQYFWSNYLEDDEEGVARAILHAAETPTRDVFVGAGGRGPAALGAYAPRLADRAMRAVFFRGSKSDNPPGPRDQNGIDGPSGKLEERGGYEGHVAETSLYTAVASRPVLAGAGIAGAALAAVAAWRAMRNGAGSA